METETSKSRLDLSFFLFLGLSALGVVLCYDFLFILAMVALPALWTTTAFRAKRGMPVFIVLSLFTVGFGLYIGYDILFSLRILLLVAPAPVLLYTAHKFRLGNTQAALYLSVAITFGLFAVFCMNALHQGKPAFSEVRDLFMAMQGFLETGFGIDSTMLAVFTDFVNNIDIYFPSVLYYFGAAYALTNVLLLQFFLRKKETNPLVPMRPFSQWRMPRSYVIVCALVMAVSLFVSYSGSAKAEMILLLSNYMLNMPLSVVGAGIVFGFFTRSGKTAARILLYVVIIAVLTFFGLSMYVLSILGFLSSVGFRRVGKRE